MRWVILGRGKCHVDDLVDLFVHLEIVGFLILVVGFSKTSVTCVTDLTYD